MDGTSLAIPSIPLDAYNKQTKRYFVNFENLKGRLTEIVEFREESIAPFGHPIPPYVYEIRLEKI